MRRLWWIAAAMAIPSAPVAAEVVSASGNAFHVRHKVPIVASTDETFALLIRPASWWNPEHTWSDNAANMYIETRAGGCFCERLENGGSAEHMRVAQVKPGEEIVLTGGLGPLLFAPATGTLRFKVERSAGGSIVTLDYKVFGFPGGDGATWAGAVDTVLGEQMKRLRAQAASRGSRAVP